ncbi:MAG: hypothetical protein ACE5GJ_00070 [Gemmatimonadota bacterium]
MVLVVGALFASACDSGPSGPGTLNARVEGPPTLGAAVIEVTGGGIQGFEDQGDTRVYGAMVSEVENRYRVVVISPEGGTIRFGIRVDDVGADLPSASVVTTASTDNLPALGTGVSVKIER